MTPIEKLTAAVQEFVNEVDEDAPVIVRTAVVAWEAVVLNDDGEAMSGIAFEPIGNAGPSATIGLLITAGEMAKANILDRRL